MMSEQLGYWRGKAMEDGLKIAEANDRIHRLETEHRTLRLENEKLRAVMLDLVVFGSAAIDQEADDEDRENAAAVLEASIKQARICLGLVSVATLAELREARG